MARDELYLAMIHGRINDDEGHAAESVTANTLADIFDCVSQILTKLVTTFVHANLMFEIGLTSFVCQLVVNSMP